MDVAKTKLIQFIELYKNYPCLWDQKCDSYKNRVLRSDAYEVLLKKYKEIDPNANVDTMKKKINSLRTSFRREFLKAQKSQQKNISAKSVYMPNLWFYNNLLFLYENENVSEEVDKFEALSADEESNSSFHAESFSSCPTSNSRKRQAIFSTSEKKSQVYLESPLKILPKHSFQEDEHEITGKRIGLQLKNLDSEQRIFAEKLIADVIFYGQRFRLNDETCIHINNRGYRAESTTFPVQLLSREYTFANHQSNEPSTSMTEKLSNVQAYSEAIQHRNETV